MNTSDLNELEIATFLEQPTLRLNFNNEEKKIYIIQPPIIDGDVQMVEIDIRFWPAVARAINLTLRQHRARRWPTGS